MLKEDTLMDLISPRQLVNANQYLQFFGGETLARILFKWLKLDRVNHIYSSYYNAPSAEFLSAIIRLMGVKFDVPEQDLKNIPATGPFITVSNHAYGGLDGILMLNLLPTVRPDFKVIVNFLLTQLQPLQSYFLAVNPFETYKDVKSSFGGLKEAYSHLDDGHPLGIFPSGEVSSFKFNQMAVTDKEWQLSIIKFIKKARVPVVPIYFDGHNSTMFQLLGMIHPVLRTAKIPSEMFNKRGKTIHLRIGTPITLKEQDAFEDFREYGHFLRMRTYSMGIPFKQPRHSKPKYFSSPEKIIDPVAPELIESEIESIRNEHLLFEIQSSSVFCVPSAKIPNTLREIGRLREITYREVGEGTGKSLDIDKYDAHFEQLIFWDHSAKKIVGGYRIGKGKKILQQHGIKGFYISSLFRIEDGFTPVLEVSIELGRSYIIKEYQKKTHSLFLLWKGILYLLLKNPEYRYLLGPVSISNEFRNISRSLTAEFLKANYINPEFADFVHPTNDFRYTLPAAINPNLFLHYVGKDLSRVERFIQDIDPAFRLPVLLKKYLSVNAEVIGFNVDPKFNNCLDALMVLDLLEVPSDIIEGLSKEINDQSILERFRK
ncbi:MAG TPA: lysophospholipid acyltransferase family protein [Bacteroidales bacterium]|nr:lysophospholipid acyltransferase family protein [Bacteroidales bacterium]